jgi:hypothetical protein
MYKVPFGVFKVLPKKITLEDLLFDADCEVVFVNFATDSAVKIFPYFKKIKDKKINIFLNVFKSVGVELDLNDALGALHIVLLEILLNNTGRQVLIVGATGFTCESILFLHQNFELLMNNFMNKTILVYDEKLPKATIGIDFKRGLLL